MGVASTSSNSFSSFSSYESQKFPKSKIGLNFEVGEVTM